MKRRVFVSGVSAAAAACYAPAIARRHRDAVRQPLSLQVYNNRPFITVELIGRNGRRQDALAWLDTAGGNFMLTKDLAGAIDLQPAGTVQYNGEQRFQPVASPRAVVNGITIDIASGAMAALSGPTIEPGVRGQVFLPGRIFRGHRVLFDYPGRQFAVDAAPDPANVPRLPASVDARTGLVRLEAVIDGEHVGLLLDTGASCTMFSRAFIDKLAARHPEWRSVSGAYGPANMVGSKMEMDARMLRIPQISVGPLSVHDVVAVSRPIGTFEHWMRGMPAAPVIGALGGNVLRALRLHVDYSAAQVSATRSDVAVVHEFDQVPLTLRPSFSHGYQIAAVGAGARLSVARDAVLGKSLIAIDNEPVAGRYLSDVLVALRGDVGTVRRLRIAGASGATSIQASISRII